MKVWVREGVGEVGGGGVGGQGKKIVKIADFPAHEVVLRTAPGGQLTDCCAATRSVGGCAEMGSALSHQSGGHFCASADRPCSSTAVRRTWKASLFAGNSTSHLRHSVLCGFPLPEVSALAKQQPSFELLQGLLSDRV